MKRQRSLSAVLSFHFIIIKYGGSYETANHCLEHTASIVPDLASATSVFVKRKCEQKGPKKVSTFSTRFHVVSNVFPKYQMLTF